MYFIIFDDEQFDMIRELCGEEAAADANYGKVMDGRDIEIHIHTNVYGHGWLTTIRDSETDTTIRHIWAPLIEHDKSGFGRDKYGPPRTIKSRSNYRSPQ